MILHRQTDDHGLSDTTSTTVRSPASPRTVKRRSNHPEDGARPPRRSRRLVDRGWTDGRHAPSPSPAPREDRKACHPDSRTSIHGIARRTAIAHPDPLDGRRRCRQRLRPQHAGGCPNTAPLREPSQLSHAKHRGHRQLEPRRDAPLSKWRDLVNLRLSRPRRTACRRPRSVWQAQSAIGRHAHGRSVAGVSRRCVGS
jgi:hypothetical protein